MAATTAGSESEAPPKNSVASRAATIPDALLKRKVPCVTEEGKKVNAEIGLLLQSKTFHNMWKDLNFSAENAEALDSFEFPVKAIPENILTMVLDWCKNHAGKPDPTIEEDPATRERKWFELDEYEKAFFNVEVEILAQLLVAGNFLDIPSLYLYGCQTMAGLIKDKSPEEIRDLLGLEDDLTDEEKDQIRKKNVWCQY